MNYEFKSKCGEQYIFDGENIVIFEKDKYNENEAKKLAKPIDGFRTKYFSNASLILNNNCNLGCEYCYANKGDFDQAGGVMSFETARKTIDCIYRNVEMHSDNKMGITFFGGEPLLQFDLMRKIVDYVNSINKKDYHVGYSIITNGTLFTDEIVSFLKDNNFVVTVSLDGAREVHDRMRKFKDGRGSFDVIANNIKKYNSILEFKSRLTINDNNVDVYDSVIQMRELGIENIIIGVDVNISDSNFNAFLESYKKLLQAYCNDLKNGNFYCIENLTFNLAKIVSRRRISSHCNAGRAYFTISADGRVFDCHRLVGNSAGYVCDLDNDYVNKIDKYSIAIDNNIKRDVGERIESCKDCSFKYLCGGICYHHAYTVNNNRFSKVAKDCMMTKFEIKSLLEIITSLSVERRRDFITYVMKLEEK